MQTVHSIQQLRQIQENITPSHTIGFVATMGALHAGHASLIEQSKKENDLTFVSIFVNPTQFNQDADFTNYPITIKEDQHYLEALNVDFCFLPNQQTIYPDTYRFKIDENKESARMEGEHRPGHFNGVLTVVMKLLHLIKPTRAYFGEKDYQQYLLIRDMAHAFFMDIEIKACPIVREKSGLALSSRNVRLSASERQLANNFARIFHQAIPLAEIQSQLKLLPLTVEYIEEHEKRRLIAVQIGAVRLIDNYSL